MPIMRPTIFESRATTNTTTTKKSTREGLPCNSPLSPETNKHETLWRRISQRNKTRNGNQTKPQPEIHA